MLIVTDSRDPDYFRRPKRVSVNGEDVSSKCYRAEVNSDSGLGVAYCYKHNEAGQAYLENGDIVREMLTGKVEIVPVPPEKRRWSMPLNKDHATTILSCLIAAIVAYDVDWALVIGGETKEISKLVAAGLLGLNGYYTNKR